MSSFNFDVFALLKDADIVCHGLPTKVTFPGDCLMSGSTEDPVCPNVFRQDMENGLLIVGQILVSLNGSWIFVETFTRCFNYLMRVQNAPLDETV